MLFADRHIEKYLAGSGCFLSMIFILTIVMQGKPHIQ
jgi:hypothetical protein